jgi:hypothetical protein
MNQGVALINFVDVSGAQFERIIRRFHSIWLFYSRPAIISNLSLKNYLVLMEMLGLVCKPNNPLRRRDGFLIKFGIFVIYRRFSVRPFEISCIQMGRRRYCRCLGQPCNAMHNICVLERERVNKSPRTSFLIEMIIQMLIISQRYPQGASVWSGESRG